MVRTAFFALSSALALAACGAEDDSEVAELEARVAEAERVVEERGEALRAAQQEMINRGMSGAGENQALSAAMSSAAESASAVVDITGTSGSTIGEAALIDGPKGLIIRFHADGLPMGFHGVHLHQVGDCSDVEAGFKASGSHINIAGNEHGIQNPAGFHVGADFPNIWSGVDGVRTEIFAAGLSMDQAMDEDGFAMIIHANEDDHVTQPIGGAGARIACASFY